VLNKKADEVEIEVIEEAKRVFNKVVHPYKVRVKILKSDKPEDREIKDGSFVIEYKEDGVYLTVISPLNNGKPVDEKLLIEHINRKGIENADSKAIFLALYTSNGEPVKIAPYQEEKLVDAEVRINVSKNGMEAYMRILPEDGGKPCDIEMVKQALEKANISYGIDWGAINEAIEQKRFYEDIIIARGTEHINGKDGYIEYTVQLDKNIKPKVLEDGSVDYKQLNLIKNVKKGDVLARRIDPEPGIEGHTVMNRPIPAKGGRPVALLPGKNTELSEDGKELLAAIDGQVVFRDGRITVLPIYEIISDIDNSTGNIDFIGTLKIKGGVRGGFTVNVRGDVEIGGAVEGATIISGGNIIIRSGIQGMNKAVLKAEGDVIARFIENAEVESGRNVIADAIMHSIVKAKNAVIADGRRGLIIGGNIKAGMEVRAKSIGSSMATATEIEVGSDPELREKYTVISAKVKELEKELERCEKDIQTLSKMTARGVLSPEKQRLKLMRLQNKLKLIQEIAEYKAQLLEIEQQLEQLSNGVVSVKDTIYPGVRIIIGSSVFNIMQEYRYATFKRENGEIVMGSYEKKAGEL